MSKRFAVLLACGASLALAQPGHATTPAERTRAAASAMQNTVGQELGGGLKVDAIAAEDEVLVIRVDGPAGWRANLGPDQVTAAFAEGMCEEGSSFFDAGMKLRIDTTETGADKKTGSVVASCPAR